MPSSARFSLRTLGGFSLFRDARPCELAYEKGRALLAYLAVEPDRAHSRSALATLLWPGFDREAALTNLRQVLHNLRQIFTAPDLAASPLQVDRESIRLKMTPDLAVDTVALRAVPRCLDKPFPAHCHLCLMQMESLSGQYQGEFMAGFSLPDCREFEEWLQIQREALHLHALTLFATLADCHERKGAYASALPVALRFLDLEPWNEDGLRRAMRLYALNGQRSNALAQYETSRIALKRELGITPEEETLALAGRIRAGQLAPDTDLATQTSSLAALPLALAERRQVTVIYCELSSAAVDDPDDALALLDAPQARCAAIIRSHAGHLLQAHGGGLLAYFGFPQASENAALVAVRTALTLTRLNFPGVEVRVGVHTGIVISSSPQMPDAIGATSGLATRLRQVAESGEVAISGATHALVGGYFACGHLGLRRLRGIAHPVDVFRVDGESGARTRLEAETALTPLVGRKDEIAALLALWRDACRGARRIVLLQGEAGVGKSRLVLALKERLSKTVCVIRELRCFPEHSQSPLHPLIELFAQTLAFAPEDTPEEKFAKLAAYVERHYRKKETDAIPLLAKMLELPVCAPYRESDLSAQQQREKTLAILLERQYALAANKPMLLVVEDVEWADPSTLELLDLFVEQERPIPVLAVVTARPGFGLPWSGSLAATVNLNALDDRTMSRLVAAVAPQINPAALSRIVERADGIPLFAEELARDHAAGDVAIPSSLLDLLTARLDSLGPAKTIAQSAATIGREFTIELLREVSPLDEGTLLRYLSQLQDAGLLLGHYYFKHALMRDAAYQSQTRKEREAMHRRIAAALKRLGPAVRPELLAQHRAAGGEIHEAIVCWLEAGRLASRNSASREAIAHFQSGLGLLCSLPDDAQRMHLELELQIGLGAAASSVHGYASAEGAESYERALALYSRHQNEPAIFPAVWRLWASASSHTGYSRALELARQLLRGAERSGDALQRQQGHFAVGNTLFWQGEFAAARQQLESVVALYAPAGHDRHVLGFGEDAGVTSSSYLSWVLWFLGFPDQARKASTRAVKLARKIGHPFSLGYALTFAALLHCRLRQAPEALALAQETLALARQRDFALWEIGATVARGWALTIQNTGEGSAGIAAMQQCVDSTRTAMGGVALVVLQPLVDANLALGRLDTAQRVCAEALAVGQALGDHHVEAELLRLEAECLLGLSPANAAQAELGLHKALALSRRQQARSLELRATMSLARLWQRQGKQAAARSLLEEVYHGFSEGFDTKDLRDARQLLDGLSS